MNKQCTALCVLLIAALACSPIVVNINTASTPEAIATQALPTQVVYPSPTPMPTVNSPTPILTEATSTVPPTPTQGQLPETIYTSTPMWRTDRCENAPPPLLRVGYYALVVTTGGDKLRVRAEPWRGAEILTVVDAGTRVLVIGGYDCNDGWIWWHVQTWDATKGWAAEGDGTTYWLVQH